jgi:hypothetical protein
MIVSGDNWVGGWVAGLITGGALNQFQLQPQLLIFYQEIGYQFL